MLKYLLSAAVKGEDLSYEQFQKSIISDGAANDYFGVTVSISGDGNVALIGASGDDDKATDAGSAYIFTKQADGTYTQTQKLLANEGYITDRFGYSASISSDGNVALVGALNDDDKGIDSGSAFIFTKQADGTYTQTAKLLASDGAANDHFGYSVSISSDGNVALIGAYYDDDKGVNSGSAYIFTKQADGAYSQTQKLTASDGAANDRFGKSVSISGDGGTIVIGADSDDDKGANSGSAYIFTKQENGQYTQTQKLTASDGAANDYFGVSVSISGDGNVALIGASGGDGKATDSGSAYIFTKQVNGNYTQTAKLLANDGAAGDCFGMSASISGDGNVALIGAYYDDNKATDSGSAYIFTKQANGNYTQTAKLLANDGAANDQFGRSVFISSDGNVALVGAPQDDDKGTDSGSAYIFK